MAQKDKKAVFWTFFLVLMTTVSLSGCGGGSDTPQINKEQQEQNNNTEGDSTTTQKKLTPEQGYEQLTRAMVDSVILPVYQNVKQQNLALKAQTAAFCNNTQRDHSSLIQLQSTWQQTSLAWQQARTIKLGPIADTYHYSRIQFWPISADKLASDVIALLAAEPDFSKGVASLKHQVQGLPAYEYIVFNSQIPLFEAQDLDKRCNYLNAITENIETLLINSITHWQGEYGDNFKAGSGKFTDKKQALEKLLTIWFEYLEVIKDNKIDGPLALETPGKAELVESAFSQTSLRNIHANIVALEQIYKGSEGFGFGDYLSKVSQRDDVATEIDLHFKAIYDAIDVMQYQPMITLIATNQGRFQLEALSTSIANLRSLMSSDFVQITGLEPGFNTNDGD
ncbi:hypothetical protein PSECIP111951_00235 [Pseudoalteromonas holothuriae]|uniref:Imelysin-like domain-containing protein n=1 Tax=Pseudoalteromonas holothuriae TaxID=2963714 RepID=A0ABM9GFP9_9GAMM|nr:imelysin family protein [Pseudoalteromonas sp. CIP111951]CAH9050652.1 hypothetical protein PSECIP111951_00235 [Pseudoalteromonas sp. CIP111951]